MSELRELETTAAYPQELPAFAVALQKALTIIAGLILVGTMTMTVIDVFGRYFFGAPLGFAYEMTELMMAITVFMALSAVTLRGEHINVGLFDGLFVGRVAAAREAIVSLLLVVGIGFLCWRMYLFAGKFQAYGDTTHVLKVYIYPFAYIGTLGLALAALAAAIRCGIAVRRVFAGTT